MLVDENNSDIFPLGRESLKRLLDSSRIGLGVDDEKVLLRVWRGRNVLSSRISHGTELFKCRYSRLCLPAASPLPSPVVVMVSSMVDGENGIPTDLISYDGEELPVLVVGV